MEAGALFFVASVPTIPEESDSVITSAGVLGAVLPVFLVAIFLAAVADVFLAGNFFDGIIIAPELNTTYT